MKNNSIPKTMYLDIIMSDKEDSFDIISKKECYSGKCSFPIHFNEKNINKISLPPPPIPMDKEFLENEDLQDKILREFNVLLCDMKRFFLYKND